MAALVADAWSQVVRETEDPFGGSYGIFGPRVTYRERLDRVRRNVHGERIPRITLVRANLRRLGKPKMRPRLPA